jgi:uncharacterized DUF497 family protein
MKENKFIWDESKNSSNFEKHKIDFHFASKIFFDNKRIEWENNRNDYGEIRFITIGKILNVIITVVYTLRNNTIRMISARTAKKQEKNLYNSQN